MKTIFIPFLLLFIGNQLIAQTVMIDELIVNSAPKAKLLYETEKGFVYALPQDNMPCLVPRINSNMPIANSDVPGYMPNPLLKKGQNSIKIIPLIDSRFIFQKKLNFPKPEAINPFSDKK